ncbi:MAG: discoidin domain-containing protein [Planctomycetaceae bacterium]|nr:discoidin domain-containing protein [Planctomycetaceae bacterium]
MKKYLIGVTFTISLLYGMSDGYATGQQRALLVGEQSLTGEFRHYLQHYGAEITEVSSLRELKSLDNYTILVICASSADKSQELTSEQSKIITNFISDGGRAYIEYTAMDCNVLPGWNIDPHPILNRFENIAVARNNPVNSHLEKDDLLEEHNSYLLNVTAPANAEVLLQYGLYLGTYKVAWQIKESPTNFTITVDLGQERQLKTAMQWYGGLNANYVPDLVRLSIAGNDLQFREIAEVKSESFKNLKADVPLDGKIGRYVRFYIEKWGRPNADFVALNGIEIYDVNNQNVAKDTPYIFQVGNIAPENAVSRSLSLTKGEKPRHWQEDSEYLFSAPKKMEFNKKKWNALIGWPLGKGHLYYASTSLSTFRKNNYRLTRRWESLIQGLSLSLFPENQQTQLSMKLLPLHVYTEPRTWSLPGQEVKIHIFSEPAVDVKLICQDINFSSVKELEKGHYLATCSPQQGEYTFGVKTSNALGWNENAIALSVQPRTIMYRRALDKNMRWFLNSGVLPQKDGTAGIKSTIELGAIYAGQAEDLSCPFRLDCQATTAKAFYMYGDVCQDKQWHRRAENIAANMLQYQFTDSSEPAFGGWKWLFYDNNAIYPQDDNNRDSECMAWLYTRIGNKSYLKAALRNVEFVTDTSREDSTLAYWVTAPETVNNKGRAYLRTVYNFDNFSDWCLYRYHYAYRASGDASYRKRLDDLIRIYAPLTLFCADKPEEHGISQFRTLQTRGLAVAINYLKKDDPLRQKLVDLYNIAQNDYLQRSDVQKYGRDVVPNDICPAEIGRIYNNDCSINTFKGEPLSDQLYSVPKTALMQWEVFKASSGKSSKKNVEATLDYLVRIQFTNSDTRLDGCWMRSFDMENWEYYGTRYDSNYGAYCAYTGWMNSLASTTLAYYLLNENPFAYDEQWHQKAAEIIGEVRKERVPEYMQEINHLKDIQLKAERQPDLGSKSTNTLTDGIIEGLYSDDLSAGWSPTESDDFSITLKGDIGYNVECCRLSIRTGGLIPDFCPDHVVVYAGLSMDKMQKLLDTELISKDGANWLEFNKQKLRYVNIKLSRSRLKKTDTPVYVGEIQLIGLQTVTSR